MELSFIYGEVFRNLGRGTELETGILRRRASRRGNSRRRNSDRGNSRRANNGRRGPMCVVPVTSMVPSMIASVIISSGMDGGVTGARVGGDHSGTPRLG